MNKMAVGNWFLLIGKQWASLLAVFLPKNLKLFSLITINAFFKSTKVFLKYFWWMLLINVGVGLSLFPFNSFFIRVFWALLMWFFMLCSLRPSVQKKTSAYFLKYLPRFGMLLMPVVAIAVLQWIIAIVCKKFALNFVLVNTILLVPEHFIAIRVPSVLFLYVGYFLLDSDGTVFQSFYSVIRGLKMFVYTYPFCLISMLVFISLEAAIVYFMGSFAGIPYIPYIGMVFLWLYYMFVACWFNTMYIKKAHENFHLYFE